MKDRISVGRFVSSAYCGMLGKAEMEDILPHRDNQAMQRGRDIHTALEAWANGLDVVWEDWQEEDKRKFEEVLDKLPGQSKIVGCEESISMKFESIPYEFMGIVDLLTNDACYELKTGKPREWHRLQIMAYNMLFNKKVGYLVYFDTGEVVEVKERASEADVLRAYRMMVAGQPSEKNVKCEFCDLKKQCPTWVEDADEMIQELIANRRLLMTYEHQKKSVYEVYMQPIDAQIKEAKEKEEKLMEIVRVMKRKKYEYHDASVSVYDRKSSELPTNWQELRPFDKYPQLYNEPKPKLTDMKKEIGIETVTSVVKVDIGEI